MGKKPREQWGDYKLYEAINEILGGRLYHLTDWAHATSIDEHGLLSKCEAYARGIYPAIPGGSDLTRYLDDRRGVLDDVFLGFTPSGLMPKDPEIDRQRRPLMLHIDPKIVIERDFRVSLGRSTRSRIVSGMCAVYEMDWEILLKPELRTEVVGLGRWNSFLNYELLFPKCVPRHYIIGCE
jgi:hypothetical protein